MYELVEAIVGWQQQAINIKAPLKTDRLPAVGGLAGPAFFPEGLGLSHPILPENGKPTIMAIGHNFGCQDYRNEIDSTGREDDQATWRNLDGLLRKAGSTPADCFRTNWFIGLLPGKRQTGSFLRQPDPSYEQACLSLLIEQIRFLQPRAILLLGTEVANRAYRIIPELAPWRGARKWTDIDRSSIGHSVRNTSMPAANWSTNVTALLHPSFGAANQSRRMKNMCEPTTESELIRAALIP